MRQLAGHKIADSASLQLRSRTERLYVERLRARDFVASSKGMRRYANGDQHRAEHIQPSPRIMSGHGLL